jgi:5-methylcytosine-specific restriction endonuclease McrA
LARLTQLPSTLSAPPPRVGYSDRAAAQRARDILRRQNDSLRPLYSTRRWRHPEDGVRIKILVRDGMMCQGCDVPHQLSDKVKHAPNSPIVDHKIPHRGNLALFWDEDNLQAVCKAWHDSTKQKMEKTGALARKAGGGSNP